MFKKIIIINIILVLCCCTILGAYIKIVNSGPKYKPTDGKVWPKPQYQEKNCTYYSFNPSQFKVTVTQEICDLLTKAIERYSYIVKKNGRPRALPERRVTSPPRVISDDENFRGAINELEVELTAPCETYPYLDMNESYNLTVGATSLLSSASVWGIIRGLETFAQLFYFTPDRNAIIINATVINDYPRYAHRGLLLDTARHYISMANILKTLDAMAINKMNVFHWHIVDDQSFPYDSEKFPELSSKGAYDSSMIYTHEDIDRVVEYARERGIRVIPEFDIPGHTRSWGNAYPNILTECYQGRNVAGLGPMNPTNNSTYKLIRDLFQEAQSWFPDKYFHVGGDEVMLDCWKSNPRLNKYMTDHNMTVTQLHGLFMSKVIPLLANGSKPIVWQEVFDERVPLSKDTLIQVWKYNWISEMIKILERGHKLIFSSSWYLDNLKQEWHDYFTADPRQMVYDKTHSDAWLMNIVGGEACMWGEMVDDRNVISRVWPRASAVAERLWSPELVSRRYRAVVSSEDYRRIEEHTCRMIRRGIDAAPASGPGFCVV